MAVTDFLDRGVRLNPKGECFVYGDKTFTYTQVQKFTYQVANKLLGVNLKKGAKAAILSINDPIAYSCAFAIMRAGLVWVPVNPKNSINDNQYIIDFFDCEVLFYHSLFSSVVDNLRKILQQMAHHFAQDVIRPIGE